MTDKFIKRLANLTTMARRKAPPVGTTPADVIHRENKWRLLRYRASTPRRYNTPVLLVPSLINRHYVLDLLPGKSFAEYLVGRGHDVFTIDWGTPGDEDRYLTFDDIADRYMGRALLRTGQATNQPKAHVLGYCLGGTLAAMHAAVHPDAMASIVALAAPIRFADDGLLSAWTRTPTFNARALLDAFGNVPWQLMQSAFHMLRPTLNLAKGVHFLDRAWDDEFIDGFVALETWGNDNVSFPGECYRQYLEEIYRADGLMKKTFAMGGKPVDLGRVTCPTLAITFEHDHIVPWKSASALLEIISSSDKEHVHLPGGHVGAVVSRAASKSLWPKISDFWAARDSVTTTTLDRRRSPRTEPERDVRMVT